MWPPPTAYLLWLSVRRNPLMWFGAAVMVFALLDHVGLTAQHTGDFMLGMFFALGAACCGVGYRAAYKEASKLTAALGEQERRRHAEAARTALANGPTG